MADKFDKTNTITVNRNDKDGNEARPDFKADINIGGVRYFASLWQKDGDWGTFLAGPVEKADDKYQPGAAPAEKPAGDNPAVGPDGKPYF